MNISRLRWLEASWSPVQHIESDAAALLQSHYKFDELIEIAESLGIYTKGLNSQQISLGIHMKKNLFYPGVHYSNNMISFFMRQFGLVGAPDRQLLIDVWSGGTTNISEYLNQPSNDYTQSAS